MGPLNKGVLFGPIRNRGSGESKILLKFDRERGVKKRRQFVLEDVANWHKVSAFGEEGADALKNAHRRFQISKMNRNANRSWDRDITKIEREGTEE